MAAFAVALSSPPLLREHLADFIEDASNEIAAMARLVLERAFEHWRQLDEHVHWCDQRIAAHNKDDDAVKVGTLCPSYTGGYWLFYRLSNGGFFMAPTGDQPLRIQVATNGYAGSMSAQAAGITACLFAFCQLANAHGREQERFIELHHRLRDFVAFHPEAGEIFRAID